MNSPTRSGFAAWYIECALGILGVGLILEGIWQWGVRHGRRVESEQQLNSFDAFMNDVEDGPDIVEELEEMYNRPSLFDQDAE